MLEVTLGENLWLPRVYNTTDWLLYVREIMHTLNDRAYLDRRHL